MDGVFLKVFNMAVSAGYLVVAVLVARLLLRRAPRWVHCLLWGLVGLRLILPVSLESVLSLIPSQEVVSPTIITSPAPQIQTGLPVVDGSLNPVIGQTLAPAPSAPVESVNPAQVAVSVAAWVWVAGVAVLLLLATISYWRLRRQVAEATPLKENIFQCQNLPTTFILGIFKPRIYISYNISEEHLPLVLAHEQAHLRRRDHWIKPLAYLLLAVYWFHPLTWVGYILLCRDIELACDEKVMRAIGHDTRRAYAEALLYNGVHSRRITACPLAFGEVGIKERVKSVMHYKKPAFWIVVVALVACTVVAVCFLTSPKAAPTITGYGTADEDVTIRVTELELEGDDPHITLKWTNAREKDVRLFGLVSLEHEGDDRIESREFLERPVEEYTLPPGETYVETVSLKTYRFDVAGSYKMYLKYVPGKVEAFEHAWVTFTLPEELAERLVADRMQEGDLYPKGQAAGFRQITDGAFLKQHGYHVYYYGFDSVKIKRDGRVLDLQEALNAGTVTMEEILQDAFGRVKREEIQQLSGGESGMYVFDTYKIVKQYTSDGRRCCFIASPDLTFEQLNSFSPENLQVQNMALFVEKDGGLHRLTDDTFRKTHGFDVYTYEVFLVQMETNQGLRDLQGLLLGGTVTVDQLLEDARRLADEGKVKRQVYKDGGSELFRFDTYTLIKANRLDGDRNLYITAPGYDLNDVRIETSKDLRIDITGDGEPEIIQLFKQSAAGDYTLNFLHPDGTFLWQEEFGSAHPLWNTLFLYTGEKGAHLLRYIPYVGGGGAYYYYKLYRIPRGSMEVTAQRDFDVDFGGRQPLNVPEMVSFAEEINALLKDSVLLFSNDMGLVGEVPLLGPVPGEQFLEDYDFLDRFEGDIYAEGDDLATKLQKFSDYIMTEGLY